MRQSHFLAKTVKESPKDEESWNAKLLVRGGFIRKEMAGVYSYLPLGLRVLKKIEQIIREEMEAIGGQEILMPTLQSKENWQQTGRWDTYDVLFRFKSFYSKNDYVIGPTHEEIVTPLLKEFISSYKDLPKYVFQIQTKFRDEKRAKAGLLRGREFIMKDLYSFHTDEKDAETYYEKIKKAYAKIISSVGLKSILTLASGGAFSKYSHEFQVETPFGEDTIYICDKCNVAVNEEIIKEQSICFECGTKKLRKVKAIEVGNIFNLKTRFSKAFNLRYKDKKGKDHDVVMGCYGIGPSRLMGTIAEVLHDERGIIWPKSVSPFSVHLLSLPGGENRAEKLYHDFQKNGIEVLYDDRRDIAAGEKFADADLMGIPWRMVVSSKTEKAKKVELKSRSSKTSKLAPIIKAIHYAR